MKKSYIIAAMSLALVATACNNGKSEEQIRAEVKAEMQHKQDSIKLAEAEAKINAMNQESKASARTKKASQPVPASSVAPLHDRSYSDAGNPFTYLSERRLNYNDIEGLSGSELRIMRNAIYARHGYIFKSADLRRYFSQFDWYEPRYSNVESQLSSIEKSNVAFIKSFE